jgi:hypothetical protein
MWTTPSDVAALVLHGRHLNEVLVSTVAELITAVNNSAVDKILVAAGVYIFFTSMCGENSNEDSAICTLGDRAMTIEAQVPGSVVFDGNGERRVFYIQSGGMVTLIGLNITGGHTTNSGGGVFVESGRDTTAHFEGCNIHDNRAVYGGGVSVQSYGEANFQGCNIHDNTAYNVCLHLELFLNFHPSPR